MKNLIYGILSSLLLTVGLARAAEKFDSSAQHSNQYTMGTIKPSPDCNAPCALIKPAPDCNAPCALI